MEATEKPDLLNSFFTALNQRLERIMPSGGYRFRVRLCGRLLELQFPSQGEAALIERSIAGQITAENGEPDSVFRFWRDDCTRYIGAGRPAEGMRCINKTGSLLYLPQGRLIATDLPHRTFYCCQHALDAEADPIPAWVAAALFEQWAQASGLLMLHGAGVGVDGAGVLIAARGGGGKSTLSISCLLDGMDFVGDDILLLNGSGRPQAMPYYTAVKLNPNMYQKLKPDMPVFFTQEDGKMLLDASSYPFCGALDIKAILLPKVARLAGPVIQPTAPGPVLSELIQSTVQAVTMYYRPDLARMAAMRLAGLPVYEMRLSRELTQNVKALRKFIEGMT